MGPLPRNGVIIMRASDRETVRKAALNELGKHHWRAIVYGPMIAKVLAPLLLIAAAAGGVWWSWRTASHASGPKVSMPSVPAPPGWLWMALAVAGVVALVVFAWRRFGLRYRLPVRPALLVRSRWR